MRVSNVKSKNKYLSIEKCRERMNKNKKRKISACSVPLLSFRFLTKKELIFYLLYIT